MTTIYCFTFNQLVDLLTSYAGMTFDATGYEQLDKLLDALKDINSVQVLEIPDPKED